MASVRGKIGFVESARVREMVEPSFGWTGDSNCHHLLLDLPDFRKEDIKVQIDNMGHLKISGERRVSDNKNIFFGQSYKVPENSDIQKTKGKFEDGLLTVTVPKQVIEAASEIKTHNEKAKNDLTKKGGQEEETENARNDHVQAANQEEKGQERGRSHHMPENRRSDGEFNREMFCDQVLHEWGEERSVLRTAIQMVNKNKGIIITAVVAFSLGILVAHYTGSSRHDESLD